MGKHPKQSHHHKPAIERALPMERIIDFFSKRFGDPYLDPSAELSFDDFTRGFPELGRDELEDALNHWTMHSGEKLLQTKILQEDKESSRVWYLHGLSRPRLGFF